MAQPTIVNYFTINTGPDNTGNNNSNNNTSNNAGNSVSQVVHNFTIIKNNNSSISNQKNPKY